MKKNFLKSLFIFCITVCVIATVPFCVSADGYGENIGQIGADAQLYYDEATGTITVAGTGSAFDWDYYRGMYDMLNLVDNIKHMVVEEGITTICENGPRSLSNLETISLPDTLTDIEDGAFEFCENLKSVNIPANVKYIGSRAFRDGKNVVISFDSANAYYKMADGVLYNADMTELIHYSGITAPGNFIVPDSVTKICEYAFYKRENIKSITFPSSMDTIGKNAFYECTNLHTVNMPSSLNSIGEYAFAYTGIESIHIPEGIETIEDSTFCHCTNLKTVTMSDSVKYIEAWVFQSCTSLENLTLSNNLWSTRTGAFERCSSLKKVTMPSTMEFLGPNTFKDCTSLTEVYLNEGLIGIEDGCFWGCSNLENLHLPSTVQSIEYDSIAETAIKQLNIPKNCHDIGGLFATPGHNGGIPGVESCTVDEGNLYYTAKDGVVYNNVGTKLILYPRYRKDESFTVPEGVTYIGDRAFQYVQCLKTVTLPDSLKVIEEEAFAFASTLENVNMGKNVYLIKSNAFEGSGIKSIVMPDSVTSISYRTFYNCMNLSDVKFGKSLRIIRESAFEGCEALTNVTLPDMLATIESRGFYGTGLVELKFPKNLIKAGENAFCYCDNLVSVEMNDKFSDLGEGAFSYCKKLETVKTSHNLTVVKSYAFYECRSLKEIEFGPNLTRIENQAFYRCEALEKVNIGDQTKIMSIGKNAFAKCELIEEIHIGKSLVIVEERAFDTKNAIDNICFSGNEDDWKAIIINSYNYGITGNPDGIRYRYIAYGEPKNNHQFKTKIYNGKELTVNYSDEYFKNSAYKYNHALAQATMKLALSAFGAKNTATQYSCAKDFLNKAYFNEIDYNEWYTKKPERNSIAVIAGNKHIEFPDGEKFTVIAVALRGGNYKAEWSGNFNVVNQDGYDVGDGEHTGFAEASRQVREFLKQYIDDYAISGRIKIWITGYSRAAATTNLTAAYLDNHPECLGEYVTLEPKDIYAYCFEAPRGAINPDNASGLYDHIFSIVNQNDAVPLVAMRKWNFDRYGITKFIPSALIYDETKYNQLEAKVEKQFESFWGDEYLINKTYFPSEPRGQGEILNRVVDKLAEGVGNPGIYVENYQDIFEYIGEEVIAKSNLDDLLKSLETELKRELVNMAGDILGSVEDAESFKEAVTLSADVIKERVSYPTVRGILKNTIANVKDSVTGRHLEISDEGIDRLAKVILDIGIADIYSLVQGIGAVGQGHEPALCMAWLDNTTESDFTGTKYRYVYIKGDADVDVYNAKNELVARIENGVPRCLTNSSMISFAKESGVKGVIVPATGSYRVETTIKENVAFKYAVIEHDYATGQADLIRYENVDYKSGDKLICILPEYVNGVSAACPTLYYNDASVNVSENIKNASPISVSVSAEGNGNVSTGGNYYKGEYVTLYAQPAANETFMGWYIEPEKTEMSLLSSEEDALLSADSTYTFCVEDAVKVRAKFTSNNVSVYIADKDGDIIDTVSVAKGKSITLPAAPKRPYCTFKGYYAKEDATSPLSGSEVYTEDTVIYALYTSDFTYDVTGTGDLMITGYTGSETSIAIPDVIDGYTVTTLADTLNIASAVEFISIPDTVTAIGTSAFKGIKSLTGIEVEDGNNNYSGKDGVLYNRDMTALIYYPERKTTEYFEIPQSVTTVMTGAIVNDNIISVAFYEGISEICESAFTAPNIKTVFYRGTSKPVIRSGNNNLAYARSYYEYDGTTAKGTVSYAEKSGDVCNIYVNVEYAAVECTVIACLYNGDGSFAGFGKTEIQPGSTNLDISVDCDSERPYMAKVFFWNSMESLAPMGYCSDGYEIMISDNEPA